MKKLYGHTRADKSVDLHGFLNLWLDGRPDIRGPGSGRVTNALPLLVLGSRI